MINFTRAFDSAWERTIILLFRPFDLGKWCVIGFSAFLAGLLAGGNGLNTSFNQNFNPQSNSSYDNQLHQLHAGLSQFVSGLQVGLVILLAGALLAFGLAIVVLCYWLGARGQFLLLDNVVRNRAVIAWPWRFYARPANGVFVLYLIFLGAAFGVFIALLIPAVILFFPFFSHPQWPGGGRLAGLIVVGVVYLVAVLAFSVIVFIFREWGVPLIFRNGLTARAALIESLGLIWKHPGTALLFILLRIAIWIAVAILSVLACCFTCCLAILPYVGTVVLLPALIYVRCFSLDCLAQFGPEYDIWTVDVPQREIPLPNPLPPPG